MDHIEIFNAQEDNSSSPRTGLPHPQSYYGISTPELSSASASKIANFQSRTEALPMLQNHTTDQLEPDGDEYIPREYDEAGEKRVTSTGDLLDGREYRCCPFFLPNRGNKIFILASECARVLGFPDVYVFFASNRSLYQISTTQAERDYLIAQSILPFAYHSQPVVVVTAKSIFRQFGSRVIANGRRVRDDYLEKRAQQEGFKEEDLAGEKRAGAV